MAKLGIFIFRFLYSRLSECYDPLCLVLPKGYDDPIRNTQRPFTEFYLVHPIEEHGTSEK